MLCLLDATVLSTPDVAYSDLTLNILSGLKQFSTGKNVQYIWHFIDD